MPIKSRGFTLIELLVVISILGILAAIGFASYQVVLKNGRDAKRQSDLRAIQSALEQYRTDQLYYPALNTGASCSNGTFKIGCPLKDSTGTKFTYLNQIPQDPLSSVSYSPYCYAPNPSNCDNSTQKCTDYELYAKLENPPAGSTNCSTASDYNLQVGPP